MGDLKRSLVKETIGRLLYLLPDLPFQAQIEVTNKCNLDCDMCPRTVLGVSFHHMPWQTFVNVVDRLTGAKEITLTGWGEPFLHPQLIDMIAYCKEKGFYTQLTTNGLLVGDRIPEIIESGLDSITFSVDNIEGKETPGHYNHDALKNITELIQRRKDSKPQVALQAIMHRGREQDIYDVISFGASVGADRVNLGRLDPRFKPGLSRPSAEEEKQIFKRASRLGRKLGIQVDIIQYSLSRGLNRLIYRAVRRALHRFGRYCLKTYNYFYVNSRGEATPCCILPNHVVGDMLSQDLKEVWQGERFRQFRAHHRQICGKCDLWRIAHWDQSS